MLTRVEWDDGSVTQEYHPPRAQSLPDWFDKVPPDIQDTLQEVYQARQHKLQRLLVMGIRTILDLLILETVGDVGPFETKLDALEAKGLIGAMDKQTIATVIDAGSAALHRGYRPPEEVLYYALSALENVLRQVYVVQPTTEYIRKLIPPKPPRKK
jgi:hypothetical protein